MVDEFLRRDTVGLYDRLVFEDGLDIAFPAVGCDPFERTWQTKSIARDDPQMENYKVTAAGRLFKEDTESEWVPEEERPGYDHERGGFERPLDALRGSIRTNHLGWSDTDYHGRFEFHTSVDGDYVSLDAKFTDGQLVEITRND